MALSQSQAFKAGFLMKCAEQGLTPRQAHAIVKMALHLLEKKADGWETLGRGAAGAGGAVINAGGTIAGNTIRAMPDLLKVLGLVGIAAPIGVGLAAGYTGAKARYTNEDIEDAQRQNLMAEYYRLAEDAKRRNEVMRLREGRLSGRAGV